MASTVRMRALLSCAARRVTATSVLVPTNARPFHASAVALARQSRRGGRVTRAATSSKPSLLENEGEEHDNLKSKSKKTATFFTQEELDENPNFLASASEDDSDDVDDKETQQFLEGVEELFTLGSKDFGRRLVRPEDLDRDHSDDADGDADADDAEPADEIDRAERIPKRRLLKVLDDFDAMKPRGGKNAEGMPVPKTKMAAPLEKKVKKINVERVSHRQERVEMSVLGFVQNLLLEDSDALETDVFAYLVEASVAPDLRRVILFWEPARHNSENQTIAKKKVEGVQKRLEKLEKFIRMAVTRHLNLKYSPVVQFKRYKQSNADETRALFDKEMAWLDRFKK